MAYWLIPFTSRNGDGYTIRISGAAGANPITLKGAADPFVTQEDDDRDMFKPVRLQSGYLRIVDTGGTFDWHDLMPTSATSRKVELVKVAGGVTVVVWQGFIRPETFSGTFRELPQEREFPICCPLSTLESFDVNITDAGVHNFAWLIIYLFETYYNITLTNFYFSRPQDIESWLRTCWQRENLFDDDGKPKYNGLELLEEICKFWGWTCRIDGTSIYFLQPYDSTAANLAQLSRVDMLDIAEEIGIDVTGLGWHMVHLSSKRVLAGGSEEYVQGIKNAKVVANINKIDDIVKLNTGEWVDDYKDKAIDPGVTAIQTSKGYLYVLYDSVESGDYTITKESDEYIASFQSYPASSLYTRSGYIYVNELFDGDPATKHNYNFDGMVVIYGTPDTSSVDNYIFKLETKHIYSYNDGVIVLNISRSSVWAIGTLPPCTLTVALSVGQRWWNGSTWAYSFSTFTIYFPDDNIEDNRQLNGPYAAYTGTGIPVSSLGGKITFYVFGITDLPSAVLNSIEISFSRTILSSIPTSDNENTYEASTVSNFSDDVSVNTIFATDNNNEYGTGLIMANGAYASGVEYSTSGGSQQEHPEQHLVDRIAAYGSTVKKVLSVGILNADLTPVSPATKMTDENGTTYTPVAISHEWADDITDYTLMEI